MLARALHNPEVHFLEVDVSVGTYRRGRRIPFNLCDASSRNERTTSKSNQIIACHYPTNTSSDLMLVDLFKAVREYNRSILHPDDKTKTENEDEDKKKS